MTGKLFRVAMVGLVGYAMIVPLSGCEGESSTKPTIDTSGEFKAPSAPTTQKAGQYKGKEMTALDPRIPPRSSRPLSPLRDPFGPLRGRP